MARRLAAAAAVASTAALSVIAGCGGGGGGSASPAPSTWAKLRAQAAPLPALAEFGTPAPQPLACDGWEDGICISRDGLHLYAVYVPADLLSFTIDGGDQTHAADYLRGPTLGMDLHTPPAGVDVTTWLHGSIVHASRTSTAHRFSAWHLTTMARPVWSEGAPNPQGPSGGTWDLFAYTTNEHPTDYKAHIALARNAAFDPAVLGTLLPAPVTTSTTEDNPHIERLDASHLVLFFDSDDRPGGSGLHDIWWTTSADDGASWAAPAALTSINTASEDEQPHLYHDGTQWWLYFTATNPGDGKLAIWRAVQGTPGDWNSWTGKELVISAGNTAGVGEPTLTSSGDLSFVVVLQDPDGTATNRYDADPWFMPRRPSGMVERSAMHAASAAIVGVR